MRKSDRTKIAQKAITLAKEKARKPRVWLIDDPGTCPTDGEPAGWWIQRGGYLEQVANNWKNRLNPPDPDDQQRCLGCDRLMPLSLKEHCDRCTNHAKAHAIALKNSLEKNKTGGAGRGMELGV